MNPLEGKRIAVTRSAEDFEACAESIRRLGGIPLACPMITFAPPDDTTPLDECLRRLREFNWILFTSAHSVQFFWMRLEALGLGAADLSGVPCAAIGPATTEVLRERGIAPAFEAERSTGETFFEEFRQQVSLAGQRFLIPGSQIAHKTLPNLLRRAGGEVWDVVAYTNQPTGEIPGEILSLLHDGRLDYILFTSSSTVEHFMQCLPPEPGLKQNLHAASIGPSTSATLRAHGVVPILEAQTHSLDGLLETIIALSQA